MAQPIVPSTTPLILFAIFSFLLPWPSHSTDPSPLQDFCVADLSSSTHINGYPCKDPADVTSHDFFIDAFKEDPTTFSKFRVNITQVNVNLFPGLNTLGLSMNRVVFMPGGLNPPHVHPRASELTVVVEGLLLVGWVTTGDVFYWKILTPGELFVIPPGLVHFQLNVGGHEARFYASFNSQNPGLQIVSSALLNSIGTIHEVLTGALQVERNIIERIKSGLSMLRSSH